MNKEDQIASIKQRIIDEYRKHKTLDWAEIAARKIYSTHLAKEICNLPVISNSLLELDGKTIPIKFKISKHEPKIIIDFSNDC